MNYVTSESIDSSFSVQDTQKLGYESQETERFLTDQTTNEIISNYMKNYIQAIPPKKPTIVAEKSNSLLFRYEGGGVVVYDSKARRFDDMYETETLPTRFISPNTLKDIETAAEYGN